MEQAGFKDGKPIIPKTTEDTNAPENKTAEQIAKLAEQVSQTQEALGQLVNIQKAQLTPPEPKPEPLKAPEEFVVADMMNPETESGKYFMGVLKQREEHIANSLRDEYRQLMDQKEKELRINSQYEQLAKNKKLEEKDLEEFKGWINNPENVNVDTLYDVFERVHKGKSGQDINDDVFTGGRVSQAGAGVATVSDGKGFLEGLK